MQVHTELTGLPPSAREAVVAIGNFDGVHLGHREVIATAQARAHDMGRPSAVLSFEPHPRRFFNAKHPPFRLTLSRDRIHALSALGVDHFYELAFTQDLSQYGARAFVEQVLVGLLNVSHVVVGWDFCFGKGRGGNATILAELGKTLGFGLTAVSAVTHEGGIIYSSTAIRQALCEGDVATARALLGRDWEISGQVMSGDKRGRSIGFPTANVALGDHLQPKAGVYAVELALDSTLADESPIWHPGVANIGFRPSFGGDEAMGLEAHLFDFEQDLYGRSVRVRLRSFIRAEQKFSSIEELKAQIDQDSQSARKQFFSDPP